MRLEHYPVEQLKKEILAIVGAHLDLSQYRVFFFGSRVSGKGTDRSDIDIGIEGPYISSGVLLDIQEAIEELPTLYKIEVVDFKRVAPIFKEVALQDIESINMPAL
ncbi:nucleotidyltransferase domain-containing protein [Patescibacteria group bacterium]|nr:nucleotidyltransferase domain-containing protein [Patescibacteria group bacterium]